MADLRAPTPSAAAELVSRNQQELLQQLAYKQQRLEMALDRIFSHQQQRLQQFKFAPAKSTSAKSIVDAESQNGAITSSSLVSDAASNG